MPLYSILTLKSLYNGTIYINNHTGKKYFNVKKLAQWDSLQNHIGIEHFNVPKLVELHNLQNHKYSQQLKWLHDHL